MHTKHICCGPHDLENVSEFPHRKLIEAYVPWGLASWTPET